MTLADTEGPSHLHDAVRSFEKQRQADKIARYRAVVRKGLWLFLTGVFLRVVAWSLKLLHAQRAFYVSLDVSYQVLFGLAITGLVDVPGLDINDVFHRRPSQRRCFWLLLFVYSLIVVAEPLTGVFAAIGPASVCLGMPACIAFFGLVRCTQCCGNPAYRPSTTILTSLWVLFFRGGQSLWSAFHGAGCSNYDLVMATGFPSLLVVLVAVARLLRWLQFVRTEAQDAHWIWPLNMCIFWASYNYLCGGAEILATGLLKRSWPECVWFYVQPWSEACLFGMIPFCTFCCFFAAVTERILNFLIRVGLVARSCDWSAQLVSFSISLVVIGIMLLVLKFVSMIFEDHVFVDVATILSNALFGFAVVVISTCPPEDVDLDRAIAERPSFRTCLGLGSSAYVGVLAYWREEALYLVPAAVALLLAFSPRQCLGSCVGLSERSADLMCAGLVSKHLVDAWFFERSGFSGCSPSDTATAATLAVKAVISSIALLWCRWLRSAIAGLNVASATSCFYLCSYANFTFWGLQEFGEGCFMAFGCPHSEEMSTAVLLATRGIATLSPMLVLLVTGRGRVFQLAARSFDRNPLRVQRDGAFLATLLNSVSRIQVGDAFWVHHGRNDEVYPALDARRNWQQGEVVSVAAQNFTVRTRVPEQMAESSLGAGTSASRSSLLFRRRLSLPFSPPESHVLHELPMAGREMTVESMLSFAQQELRCIDWCLITREVMTGAICGHGAPDISRFYSLSRPLQKGEIIDYFLSHSWHDCAETKWTRLNEVVAEFVRSTWRDPTFWLDKVCIHQRRIADGLKALPVNVMACRQVLVLCGTTYPDRLWCIWELCVVLSFASQEQAMEKIRFEVFGQDSSSQVLERLESFDAMNARCYDPNEQHKLFQVIHTIGIDSFNEKIRQLAAAIPLAGQGRADSTKISCSESLPSSSPQASVLGARSSDDDAFAADVVSI
eukprot:TRINITY_DN31236_c0_g1_i9.p1 TRINITY_DN31236_c0_g1~~TRINITY_DN31236_c0_g1_i9.p1  ORF type:complete len:951 (-),score=43.60 TRINITY_DN31236_c0_g1_i9:23-2875(-)